MNLSQKLAQMVGPLLDMYADDLVEELRRINASHDSFNELSPNDKKLVRQASQQSGVSFE
jgi:hypothetical protein